MIFRQPVYPDTVQVKKINHHIRRPGLIKYLRFVGTVLYID